MVTATGRQDLVIEDACELPTDWMDDAACHGTDPETFFPDGEHKLARTRARTAKLICRDCPVSLACLAWAMESGQDAGIWGGRTEDERRQLRRRRRRWS